MGKTLNRKEILQLLRLEANTVGLFNIHVVFKLINVEFNYYD